MLIINKRWLLLLLLVFVFLPFDIWATPVPALMIKDAAGQQETYSVSLQIIGLMTALTLLPALILTMTSFTRVIIVLGILRQAMGMPQTPSNQILLGLALFLTFFIMAPTFEKINQVALTPYMEGQIELKEAVEKASSPMKDFMFNQTRKNDLQLFADLTKTQFLLEDDTDAKVVPLSVLIPAFVTSELKTAFQIGFLLFIPFLMIDLVVASVLMAMGMMMLSPLIISLPFKIMLFVLVDGWTLVLGTLASSYGG